MKSTLQTTNDMQLKEQFRNFFGSKTEDEAREMLTSFRQLQSYYQCAMLEVETKFRVLNEEFSLRYDRNLPLTVFWGRVVDFVLVIEL